MINIAIVEDELQEARQIAGYLKKFAAANRLQISVKAYSNAESFLAEEPRAFRLVFFDIRLPGIDGLTAALKFREKNTDAVIIFITNMVQFAIRGYEVNARDYILKPLIYSDFEFKMKKLLPLFREKDKPKAFLSVKGIDGFFRIDVDKLLYVESVSHHLCYHTESGTIDSLNALSRVESELFTFGFLKCNRCYLVNPRYIRSIRGNVIQVGEDDLQISQPRRKKFLQEYNDWLSREEQ